MSTLSLSVSDRLRRFVESQAAREGFESPDAYIVSLIENEHRAKVQARVEAKLIEGLDSARVEGDDAFWAERRQRLSEKSKDQSKT